MTIFKGAPGGSRMKQSRWFSKWFILPAVAVTMIAALVVGMSAALFTDTETSNDSAFAAWTSTQWTQTSQAHFEAGVLNNVNTTSSPGDVMLPLTSNVITNSPTTNTGSAWTNPTNAYGDGGGAATITSGAPSGNNVWGNYGFSLTGAIITQVRVRYDAWSSPSNITVAFQAVGALAAGANVSSLDVVAPACAANDILIAVLLVKDNRVVSAPDGTWTMFVDSTNTTAQRVRIFWKRATASGGTFTFTTPTKANNLFAGVISAWRGCITTATPIDATSPSISNNALSDTVSYATFNPTETTAFVVAIGVYNDDTTTAGAISGTNPAFTNRFDLETSTGTDCSMFSYSGTSDGAATGARSHTTTSGVDAINMGVLFGLVAEGTTPEQIRVDVSWNGGTNWSNKATTTTTGTEATYWDVTDETTWTPAKLVNGQLQVRADAVTVGTASIVSLDWLPVEVTYVESSGTVASQVLDTTVTGSRWDGMGWDRTLPSGTSITFEVRAQEALFAKDAGSPSWTSVGGTSPVISGLPSGQYKQWRATLTTSDASNTPTLQEARVYYYGG